MTRRRDLAPVIFDRPRPVQSYNSKGIASRFANPTRSWFDWTDDDSQFDIIICGKNSPLSFEHATMPLLRRSLDGHEPR